MEILNDKTKQVSELKGHRMRFILHEITKTRLLCRCCHQLFTCLRRGGRVLSLYYTDQVCTESNLRFQSEINTVVQSLGIS
jgi:hypothetical protein